MLHVGGDVKKFSAVGDFDAYPIEVRKALRSTGVEVVDVPHEGKKEAAQKKEAADMAILVRMFTFALDNPPPSSIMLISGDEDFAKALHTLNQRRYKIVIAVPSQTQVSSDLIRAGNFVLDWPSIAFGVVVHIPRPLACVADLKVLEGEMKQLLESTETRSLTLPNIPGEYQKLFGKPLICKHYGASKLFELCEMLGSSFHVLGGPGQRILYLYTDRSLEGHTLGPIGIFWDIENCPVPEDAPAKDISCNILKALGMHHVLSSTVRKFSAFGDFDVYPVEVREELRTTGVNVVNVPHEGEKEAADKVILVEMFTFALDNPPPSSIMLISGDKDFAKALHALNQRSYNIFIAVSSPTQVSSDLISAGNFVWSWNRLAFGEVVQISRPLACAADLEVLNGEMRQLLESIESRSIALDGIPREYQKFFRRPLVCKHYGASKVFDLCEMLGDSFHVLGGVGKRVLYLYTDPALEEESVNLGSLSEQVDNMTHMTDLGSHTTVPAWVTKAKCVNMEDLQVPKEIYGGTVDDSSSLASLVSTVGPSCDPSSGLVDDFGSLAALASTDGPVCDSPRLPRTRKHRRRGRRPRS